MFNITNLEYKKLHLTWICLLSTNSFTKHDPDIPNYNTDTCLHGGIE